MTAVKKSELNPLANSFIPSNNTNTFKYIQKAFESEKDQKATWERKGKQDSNDRGMEYRIANEIQIKLSDFKFDLLFFGSLTSDLNKCLNSSKIIESMNYKMCSLQLPLTKCSTEDDQGFVEIDADEAIAPQTVTEECSCPAVFGWIVPPDFTGNPFNFKYKCSKKYPHSSNPPEKCRYDETESVDKTSLQTLDRYYLQMMDILAEVYETISIDMDPVSKWAEKFKIQDSLEVSDSESDEESDFESLGSSPVPLIAPEIVDDGVHPLLQSVSNDGEEDKKDLVEKVEKVLGESLSTSLKEFPGSSTCRLGTVCDPPCSVWCEIFPWVSNDSIKKNVQKLENAKVCSEICHGQSSFRPIFKRSLSADDASVYGRFTPGLNLTSAAESREILILRRKYPLNYFRIHFNALNRNKYGSCDLTNRLFANYVAESSMWGKFGGADSLWRPLPECTPVSVHNKKGRERRQRTMN